MFQVEEVTKEHLVEIVRYHGANEVIDALLAVGMELYDTDQVSAVLTRLIEARLMQIEEAGL